MLSLYEQLIKYGASDYYPFHMPGHKRSKHIKFENPFNYDITEIDGFDNLHHSESILLDAQKRAASLYNSSETHFLVNGSTSGLLSAISSCTTKGGTILMARNCHKAAYNAVFLNELKVIYTYPQKDTKYSVNCGLSIKQIKQLLKNNKNIQAVIITSPTYDGILSDIESIAKEVHKYKIPLIVDEAHGAHFGFHSYFPENAISKGADIVIHSLHKTMPSLTQTALLHVNGDIVDRERLRKYLAIYQTSSPSYILMASIDNCINLISKNGNDLFSEYVNNLSYLRKKLLKLKNIRIVDKDVIEKNSIFDLDKSKLIISVKNTDITGKELYNKLLNEFHLQMEMVAGDYVLAMTSMMDSMEGYNRLIEALYEIDDEINRDNKLPYHNCDSPSNLSRLNNCDSPSNLSRLNNCDSPSDLSTLNNCDSLSDLSRLSNCDSINDMSTLSNCNSISDLKFSSNFVSHNNIDSSRGYNSSSEVLLSNTLTCYSIAEASKFKTIMIELEKAEGMISAEYIYLYPPGVPLIVPGEVIGKQMIIQIENYKKAGLSLEGMEDYTNKMLRVIQDGK